MRDQAPVQQRQVAAACSRTAVCPRRCASSSKAKVESPLDVDAVDRVHLAGNSERHALHTPGRLVDGRGRMQALSAAKFNRQLRPASRRWLRASTPASRRRLSSVEFGRIAAPGSAISARPFLSGPAPARRPAPSTHPRPPPRLWRHRARRCSRASPSNAPSAPRRSRRRPRRVDR